MSTTRGLIAEEALSKEAKNLISEELADTSDPEVIGKLRKLHPMGENPPETQTPNMEVDPMTANGSTS